MVTTSLAMENEETRCQMAVSRADEGAPSIVSAIELLREMRSSICPRAVVAPIPSQAITRLGEIVRVTSKRSGGC